MTGPGRAVFDRYPADSRPIAPVRPLGNAGGLSGASLFRFRSGQGDLVARRWPPGRSVADLEAIHARIRKAGDLGFIPVPLTTLEGRTVVETDGRTWEIAPWMPGMADPDRPPSTDHLRLAFGGLGAFLARVAGAVEVGPSPGLVQRLGSLELVQRGQFDKIRARIARDRADPASSLAGLWLDRVAKRGVEVFESTRSAANLRLPLQPCLRDARPGHFLFDGDRLSGLVDFGSMGVDTVAGDLARLLGEGVGPDRPARGIALSAFEAIRPLSVDERRAIEAFERANALLAPSIWIYWHFFEGRTFDEPDAVARGLERCLGRLDETF